MTIDPFTLPAGAGATWDETHAAMAARILALLIETMTAWARLQAIASSAPPAPSSPSSGAPARSAGIPGPRRSLSW